MKSRNSSRTVFNDLRATFGPGLLFAASAVGLSHLVQATRAGASHGLSLLGIIIIACLVKYPSLRFGSDFAALTGKSLLEDYRRQGKLVFVIYTVFELTGAAFVIAALTLFTTGLLQSVISLPINPVITSALLLGSVAALLARGEYRAFQAITLTMVVAFSLLIVLATFAVIPLLTARPMPIAPPLYDQDLVVYLLPLIGFMPTTPTASVIQSLWTKARNDGAPSPRPRAARLDFNIGYGATCALALCFVLLGAALVYLPGGEMARSNVGFAAQLLGLFSQSLGGWVFPIVCVAAFLVMYSTLLTVVDGLSRVAQEVMDLTNRKALSAADKHNSAVNYRAATAVLCTGGLVIILAFGRSFTALIDTLGLLTFLISPWIAWFNHRAVTAPHIAVASRPGMLLRAWSMLSIATLAVLSLVFLMHKLL